MSTATATETRHKIKLPSQWKVVIRNDEVTPIEYVMMVLHEVFEKDEDESANLIRQIHNNGRAVVYVHTLEVCRQKVEDVKKLNTAYQQDLKVMKEEDA
jgi:ATP-dependent Clp protease adaptor protein ClpS